MVDARNYQVGLPLTQLLVGELHAVDGRAVAAVFGKAFLLLNEAYI